VLALDHFADGVTIGDSDTSIADLFVNDDTVLDGQVCIGHDCDQYETFLSYDLLKLKNAGTLDVLFDDTSN
ncbi:hypothetical protein NLM59_11775, partial [Weeksellaceae bacterium KMM 9724]